MFSTTSIQVTLFLICLLHVESCAHSTPLFRKAVMSSKRRLHSVQLAETSGWSNQIDKLSLGQVAGVDVDSKNNLHVFHRGERAWGAPMNWKGDFSDFDLFNEKNEFTATGKINAPCLVVINGKTGQQQQVWGKNQFLLPHGITIDHHDNIWVTDVGSHTVHKFDQNHKELLSIGEWKKPAKDATDTKRMCKPTDIAVSSKNNMVYVSDGYCNNRVVAFKPNGKYFSHYEITGDDVLPHSVSIDSASNQLYVADRENGRLIRISISADGKQGTTEVLHQLKSSEKLFALHFSPGPSDKNVVSMLMQDDNGSKLQAFQVSRNSAFLEEKVEKDMYMHSTAEHQEEEEELQSDEHEEEEEEVESEEPVMIDNNKKQKKTNVFKTGGKMVAMRNTKVFEQSFLHDLAVRFTPSPAGKVSAEFFTVGWRWDAKAPAVQPAGQIPTFVKPKVHRYSHILDLGKHASDLAMLELEALPVLGGMVPPVALATRPDPVVKGGLKVKARSVVNVQSDLNQEEAIQQEEKSLAQTVVLHTEKHTTNNQATNHKSTAARSYRGSTAVLLIVLGAVCML